MPIDQRATPAMVRALVVAAMLATLAACGAGGGRTQAGLIKRINPPSASIEGVSAGSAGPVRLTLRLQNFSTVPTRFGRIEADLAIDGRPAGRLVQDAGIEIPGLSSDVVPAEAGLDPAARARLDAATAAGAAVAYRLEGKIGTTDPADTWNFTFDSRLNPVPGRAGEFR